MKIYLGIFVKFVSYCTAALCCLVVVTLEGHAALAPGPDGLGYRTGRTTYDWVDISETGTPVGLKFDGYEGPFTLGFPFSFYDVSYTEFYIQSHGMINFSDEFVLWTNECPLPSESAKKNIIALMWDDLDPTAGGETYYQSFAPGSCPYQGYRSACLVVQFQDMRSGFTPISASTFEGILFDDNTIVIQFKESEIDHWGFSSTTGIQGNNFAAGHGLSYVCNTADSLVAGLAVEFGKDTNVVNLSPEKNDITACAVGAKNLQYSLENYYNNSNATFTLSYDVTSNNGFLTGPTTITVSDNSTENFQVNLTPTGTVGDIITATVTAIGAGKTIISDITMTITTGTFRQTADEPASGRSSPVVAAYDNKIWSIAGNSESPVVPLVQTYDPKSDTWTAVNGSEAPFGNIRIHSGCQVEDTVYMFLYTNSSQGLYSYNMATNIWHDLTTLPGQPDPVWNRLQYGAWVSDDGLCYITGGMNSDWRKLNSVYIFDPAAQQWLDALPSFEHGRYGHAAWIIGSGTDKKLCIAGGDADWSAGTTPEERITLTKTTQCYSFAQALWNAENADLGPLPVSLADMGYTKRQNSNFFEELWLIGGANSWSWHNLSKNNWYYDVQNKTWMVGGHLSQASGYCGAVNLNNELYKISGYDPTWDHPSGVSERLEMCKDKGCFSWPIFIPVLTGMGKK